MTHTTTNIILPTTVQVGDKFYVKGTATYEVITVPSGLTPLTGAASDGSVNTIEYYEIPHTLGEVPEVYYLGDFTIDAVSQDRATINLNVDQIESTFADYEPVDPFRAVTLDFQGNTVSKVQAQLWKQG